MALSDYGQACTQQGLGGLLGQSSQGQLRSGHYRMMEQMMNDQRRHSIESRALTDSLTREFAKPFKSKPKTIREELQTEVNRWLDDV